jgi:hypothetical protein
VTPSHRMLAGYFPVHTPPAPSGDRGERRSESLASSIQGREAAARQLRCRSTKMPQSVFKTNWLLSTCNMRGNPYEQSGGKTGGSWQLRDRAPWAVFHIQFDKHPIEPLRLRHVHRGYSCGRNIDAVR